MNHAKHILALSWNIATHPKLYRQIAPNPYSPKALKAVLERFHNASISDIAHAIVLAEPEGKYDRNFRLLNSLQQKKELNHQVKAIAGINKLLHNYRKKHAKELSLLSKDLVYETLSKVAFGSAGLKTIEERYSQNQRKETKLLIVNFIENVDDSLTKKTASRIESLKVVFAVFSFMLFFYSTNGFYSLIQNQIIAMHSKTEKHILEAQGADLGLPVRLIIPTINVNANIQDVGITSKNEMEVPNNTTDVGWFALGPHPGEVGSAVIAGHYDGNIGDTGVFNDLYKLKKGDKIYVRDVIGKTTSFVVTQSRIYDPGHADDVFRLNDKSHLNLVTCDGAWDKTKKIYSKRLVVFADIVQ